MSESDRKYAEDMLAAEARLDALLVLNDIKPGDPEADHSKADLALLEFLRRIGHGDIAEAWEQACERSGFWYA